MHYLIFIPNETIQKRETLTDAGFAGLLLPEESDPFWFQIEGSGGPDGNPGQLVLPHSSPDESHNPVPGYSPATQTWEQLPGMDCWIGWQTDNPPKPADLLRQPGPRYHGPAVELNDGHDWLIPACMDQKHVMVPDGSGWSTKNSSRWPDLYTLAEPVLAMIESNQRDEEPFNHGMAATFVCECLRLNYRVNPAIVGALSLLDQDLLPRLAALATDYSRIFNLIQELAQKKQPAPNS